ncbi:hypothetical protein [Neptunicoccus cionae]|uniref:Uncharacterized protein n=1 Tax=Neptunicoccus cionae TaxID=2035344 RepID=A0A916VRT7_9RHOB|nr:hypothetical protein [Amylibacter cionae]GGA23840.1 hypothetical protein GCM10011498_25950 [Amylibacter cionae]
MESDLKWVIGLGISLGVTFATALIASFRNLAGRVSNGDRDLHKRIDNVKDNYVRRDDLDGHIQRLDGNVRDLREEMRENHKQVIAALTVKR